MPFVRRCINLGLLVGLAIAGLSSANISSGKLPSSLYPNRQGIEQKRKTLALRNDSIDRDSPSPLTETPPAIQPPLLPSSIRVLYASTFLFVLSGSMVGLAPAQALVKWLSSPSGGGAERATTLLSLIMTGAALLEVTVSTGLGSTLDRIGRKPPMVGLLATIFLSNVICTLRPTVVTVCLSRFVSVGTMGFYSLISQTIISDFVGQVTRTNEQTSNSSSLVSVAIGTQMALIGAAFLLGILCAGLLTEEGLFVVYGISSMISASALVLVQLWLPETLNANSVPSLQAGFRAKPSFLQVVTSCTSLLTRHGPKVRVLGILLVLMDFPARMGDIFQIFTKSEWNLTPQQLSLFLAMYGGLGILSNGVGSILIGKMGIKNFTCLAIISRIIGQIGTIFFGFRGCLIATIVGFLGSSISIGIVAALVSEGAQSGLPQGELAGERASLSAINKVIGPLLYSALFVQGQKLLGTNKLPFVFNTVLFAIALMISATHL